MRYVPKVPFHGYKWRWASKQCTEGLNDPAILLGLVPRLARLESLNVKYSSSEFANELRNLDRDVGASNVSLGTRTGERNLIRNSGQYWKVLNLIPHDSRGLIRLTPLARKIASGDVSQSEFTALTVSTLELPNSASYSIEEMDTWRRHGLKIKPLRIILEILMDLHGFGASHISPYELARVVVPMVGDRQSSKRISEELLIYREDNRHIQGWPQYNSKSNDLRIIREFLLFLSNFGYLVLKEDLPSANRFCQAFHLNSEIFPDLKLIVDHSWSDALVPEGVLDERLSDVASGVDSTLYAQRNSRPRQQQFRRNLLDMGSRCFITGVDMKEVIEAAHIKPHKYGGAESIENGLLLRADIHKLYDSGHLTIDSEGKIELSSRAENNYRYLMGKIVALPDYVDREMLRWRHENRLLGLSVGA